MQKICNYDSFHLTFDDGPSSSTTETILEALNAHNATATFFLDFENAMSNLPIVEKMHDAGHTIGVHSVDHVDLRVYPIPDVVAQLGSFVEALQTSSGVTPIYFRPPYGLINKGHVRAIESELGIKTVLWSYDTNDWRLDRAVEQIISEAADFIKPGDVVLMHDGVADAPDPSTHTKWSDRRMEIAQRIGELLDFLDMRKLKSTALPLPTSMTAN